MKVTLNYRENLHFKASARKFKNIDVDEPKSFHGNDLGASPIEYFLIGIGACIGNTFIYCLKKKNVDLKNLEIIVDGQLKHVQPHMNLRLTNIKIEFKFEEDLDISDEIFRYCRSNLEKFCPISQPLLNGIPIEVKFINFK
ncbi:MAG: OsmC family protein [Candidatus Thorarchaeota archaeon]